MFSEKEMKIIKRGDNESYKTMLTNIVLQNACVCINIIACFLKEYLIVNKQENTLLQYIPSKFIFEIPRLDRFYLDKAKENEVDGNNIYLLSLNLNSFANSSRKFITFKIMSSRVMALHNSVTFIKLCFSAFFHEMRHIYQQNNRDKFPVIRTSKWKYYFEQYDNIPTEKDAIDFACAMEKFVWNKSSKLPQKIRYRLIDLFLASATMLCFAQDELSVQFNMTSSKVSNVIMDLTKKYTDINAVVDHIQELSDANKSLMDLLIAVGKEIDRKNRLNK